MRAIVPSLAILIIALGGCVDDGLPVPQATTQPLPYLLDVFPTDLDHDHADPLLHAQKLNVDQVGYASCSSDNNLKDAPGGFTDIAFSGRYAYVGTATGFCVLDIADPASPKYVSNYQGERSADLEVSPDGKTVFLLTQRNGVPAPAQRGVLEPTAQLPRGVILVNVENPAAPKFESYLPVPTNGVHTAVAYKHGDRQLLFINTYDWVPPRGVDTPLPTQTPPGTHRVEIHELSTVGGKRVLTPLSGWRLDRPTTEPLAEFFPHDGFAQFHPIIKKHLYYVAYWDAGLVVLDVDNPMAPKLIGRYADKAPSLYNQYHDVRAFAELIDGRHITVTAPELPTATEAGHVRIFDTTDPAKPVQLGTWRLPGNPGHPADSFLYSPHVFALGEGTIFVGHNHAGVWAIDVSTPERLAEPVSAGYYFPRGHEATQTWSPTSSVWGAYVHDGVVYATETTSGVHVLDVAGQ